MMVKACGCVYVCARVRVCVCVCVLKSHRVLVRGTDGHLMRIPLWTPPVRGVTSELEGDPPIVRRVGEQVSWRVSKL